ncbi:MAG: Gfo/Idh/MocA family protein [Armatimonadota bacterium]|jgi:myo-inositol 2-dehydrogenase/D-chiro-inositol 1-dehydrogenase
MAVNEARVGFVGCGVHAREVLLPAVRGAGMELAAVCDLDKRLAQRVTRRFGAFRAYQDVGKMVEEMDLDALLVCGPPEMHVEAAETGLRAGCHVWTEMPAGMTSREVAEIAELAAERKVIAQPGLMLRFAPSYRRLREIVTGEEFGETRSIEVTWWPPRMHGHDDPVAFDLPHAMDLVRFIGGEVRGLAVARGGEDGPLSVALELASGAVGTVSFGGGAGCPRERVEVAGAVAAVGVEDRQTVTLRRGAGEAASVWAARLWSGEGPERLQGFLPEMEHFAAAVSGAEKPRVTMRDAAAALHLAELAATGMGEMATVE